MMVFLPLLPPHRLYVTTFSKIYAGLSPKDDERKIQKKNTGPQLSNLLRKPAHARQHTLRLLLAVCTSSSSLCKLIATATCGASASSAPDTTSWQQPLESPILFN
jgi:hypothetical protein